MQPEHVDESLAMLHRVAGDEARWRARPFVSMSSCFVVPPLRFAEDACRCLEVAVRGGMPVLLLAAGQAGATSPAALAGAVVQEVAEVLAGLVYVNALSPGHPAIFGTWPFVSDLRTGAMSGGSGEQAVLMAACAQMGRFYDLPTGIAAGMADSKLPDAQAGYEKGYTTVLAGHSGANLVYESAGMLGSLLGACLESFVIDNDMLGAVNRSVRGIDTDDESLSVETMREVCTEGPNHFLGHPQTLGRMQRDYVYPEVGDRASPKEWGEQGSTNIVERAAERVRETLARHHPTHIPPSVDASIRAEFNIQLGVLTLTQRINDECEDDESEKDHVELLETREDAAESLQSTKQSLDFVAPLVHLAVVLPGFDPRTQRRHHWLIPQRQCQLAGLVALVRAVHDQRQDYRAADQGDSAACVLPGRRGPVPARART